MFMYSWKFILSKRSLFGEFNLGIFDSDNEAKLFAGIRYPDYKWKENSSRTESIGRFYLEIVPEQHYRLIEEDYYVME